MHTFIDRAGEILSPLILALLAVVVEQLRRLLRRRTVPPRAVDVTHREDVEVSVALERARYRLRAKRTYLTRLHNGENFLGDSCILRESRTHERVQPGASYQAENFRGVLISTLAEEMALVLEDGPSFTLVASLPQSKFRWLCEQGGVVAVARCAVKKGSRIVGFVGADFDVAEKPAEIDSLTRDAYQIGNILAGYK